VRRALLAGLAALAAACGGGRPAPEPPAASAAELWAEYARAPDAHPQIPNVSYAGYAQGEQPLPEPPVVADVRDSGARGDGRADDTAAFHKALARAGRTGGGAVRVPAGTYRLTGLLHLKDDGVVLRGDSRETSVLDFARPLAETLGELTNDGKSQWSWAGGLIWIGPGDTFDDRGRVRDPTGGVQQGWERWRPGRTLARITGEADAGARTLEVDDASALSAGARVLLTYDNPSDFSLLREIAGHPKMADYPWAQAVWLAPPAQPRFEWPVRVARVEGRRVTLSQPLRLPLYAAWNARLVEPGAHVVDSGVERLTLRLHAPPSHHHLRNRGHSGVYVNRAWDAFVRDVDLVDAENGVIVAASKNVTVRGVRVTGSAESHHPFACRVSTHEALFEDFVIDGPARVRHGINTEWLSGGNVWRRGRMERGTFDSHRGLSFDSLRTDIELRNDEGSSPGGAPKAGPYLGRRVVHWNVRVRASDRDDPGAFVNQCNLLPRGALVGVQGAPTGHGRPASMLPGRKGCRVASPGERPEPADLYAAQLALRLGRTAAGR
jgi:hypothetical protein